MSHSVDLNDEAYDRLEAARRDGESFSDVVCRLLDERPLADYFGVLDDQTADELEATIEPGRGRWRK